MNGRLHNLTFTSLITAYLSAFITFKDPMRCYTLIRRSDHMPYLVHLSQSRTAFYIAMQR